MSYIEELFGVKNKVAVVTGGTGVLGQSLCTGLAQAGAKVVVLGRRKEAADELVSKIIKSGGEALSIPADVLKEDELTEARKKIIGQFGAIDILINGAGGNIPGAIISPDKTFVDLEMDDFQKLVELNVAGNVRPSKIFGEGMV